MKIYVPTNPFWYFAVLVLIAPFLAVQLINPAWIVRMLAIFILQIGAVLIGLYYGLTIHKTIKEDAPLVKKYGKQPMIWIVRIFLMGFILFLSLNLPSLLKDFVSLVKSDAPLIKVAIITKRDGRLITDYINLDTELDASEPFTAWYFSPRYFKVGNTYEFLYLPNTRFILGARLIKEGSQDQ